MTIPVWHEDIYAAVLPYFNDAALQYARGYTILQINDKLALNLISPAIAGLNISAVQVLQQDYKEQGIFLINLWEDVWHRSNAKVLQRLTIRAGERQKIHARQTLIKQLDPSEALDFIDKYHLLGAGGYYKPYSFYGLYYNGALECVAALEKVRNLHAGPSVELSRYVLRDGTTIAGGLSKICKAVINQGGIYDITTYIDKDWSVPDGFIKAGFVLHSETPPLYFKLIEGARVKCGTNETCEIFNMGNYKLKMYAG